jgi:hypothetical protein
MPVAAAVATVAVGVYSANKAEKAAKRAQASQDSAAAQDLAFRQEQYDKWVNEYETPLIKPMLQKVQSEGPLNLGPSWANIQGNFDASGRNLEAAYARSGMTGSGANRSGFATLESGRASALGDAFQKGLQSKDALKLQLANMGKSMPQQATNLQQGYGNQVDLYGQRLSQANNAAAGSWGAVGSGLNALGQAWPASFNTQPKTIETPMPQYDSPTTVPTTYTKEMPLQAATYADSPAYMRASSPVSAPRSPYRQAWDTYVPNTNDY